jgi:hypothetical protein
LTRSQSSRESSGVQRSDVIRPSPDGYFPELLPGHLRVFLGEVALGNGGMVRVGAMRTLRGVFVGIVGYGADEFCGVPVTAEDVRRQLGIRHPSMAGNVADLVNDQMAMKQRAERQGTYLAQLCEVLSHVG